MQAIPVLLVATFVTYLVTAWAADPLGKIALCTTCDDSAANRLIELYQLDKPVFVRYFYWLGDAITGDFGTATSQGEIPVGPLLADRFVNTVYLAIPSFIIAGTIALVLAVYSALRQYSVGDYAITSATYLGISMPTFFFALLLQTFLGFKMNDWWGWKPFVTNGMFTGSVGAILGSFTLPVITLAVISIAGESRFARASILEIKNAEYIRTARAKGLPERRVVGKHMLRNIMIVMVTIWALDFGALLSGAVVTESIFSWPGLGRLLISAIFSGDLDVTMAVVTVLAIMNVSFNLLADLLYGLLDPRVRYE